MKKRLCLRHVINSKGKVFAYSSEPAIKPFINLVIGKAKLGENDYNPL